MNRALFLPISNPPLSPSLFSASAVVHVGRGRVGEKEEKDWIFICPFLGDRRVNSWVGVDRLDWRFGRLVARVPFPWKPTGEGRVKSSVSSRGSTQ